MRVLVCLCLCSMPAFSADATDVSGTAYSVKFPTAGVKKRVLEDKTTFHVLALGKASLAVFERAAGKDVPNVLFDRVVARLEKKYAAKVLESSALTLNGQSGRDLTLKGRVKDQPLFLRVRMFVASGKICVLQLVQVGGISVSAEKTATVFGSFQPKSGD